MGSSDPPPMGNGETVSAEMAVGGSIPNKKNRGKFPKKIHKAEREKLKRDNLNELFLELGHTLEPARQNNAKASILGDATRILHDLIAQIEALRKENTSLLSESRYVTLEKNELRDENIVLEAEVSRLENVFHEKLPSDNQWCGYPNAASPVSQPQPTSPTSPVLPPPLPAGPLYIISLHQDLQHHPDPTKPPSNVSRPQARYPTQSDSWPLDLLSRHPRAEDETRHSGRSNGNTSTGGSEYSSDKLLADSSEK